jgi:dTDP-glucose 4,6-dehydratase
MYVLDHCAGIDLVLHDGQAGEIYNVGGGNERENMTVIYTILDILDKPRSLIHFVKDRPGHDLRYSVDTTKLEKLGWSPRWSLDEGLRSTVDWYANNPEWWKKIKSGEFAEYYAKMYGEREVLAKHA